MWELDGEESWVLNNWCFWTVVLEKTLESPLDCKEIQPVHPKGDQSWVFIGRTDVEAETNTLATSYEELTLWKIPWCWEGLGTGGEGDERGWDGWMASPTQWTWVWVDSRSWWWIGRPGLLRFMGSQGVGHDWATEMNWTEPTGHHSLVQLILNILRILTLACNWAKSSLILLLPIAESQPTGTVSFAGKDWRQEKKGKTEDEIVRWHQWLHGNEFEETQGDSERQGSLECWSSWGS